MSVLHPQACPLCGETYNCPPAKPGEIPTLTCGECESETQVVEVVYTRKVTFRVKARVPVTAGGAARFDTLRTYARAMPFDPYTMIMSETVDPVSGPVD